MLFTISPYLIRSLTFHCRIHSRQQPYHRRRCEPDPARHYPRRRRSHREEGVDRRSGSLSRDRRWLEPDLLRPRYVELGSCSPKAERLDHSCRFGASFGNRLGLEKGCFGLWRRAVGSYYDVNIDRSILRVGSSQSNYYNSSTTIPSTGVFVLLASRVRVGVVVKLLHRSQVDVYCNRDFALRRLRAH